MDGRREEEEEMKKRKNEKEARKGRKVAKEERNKSGKAGNISLRRTTIHTAPPIPIPLPSSFLLHAFFSLFLSFTYSFAPSTSKEKMS
jgi:hypothetical protein